MRVEIYYWIVTDAYGEKSSAVAVDPCDWICVNGIDMRGERHQFDSTEAYYVHEWAEKHGFTVQSGKKEIEI